MFDKLKQLNDLRRKQNELQRELEMELVEVEGGQGAITIEINGAQKVTKVSVNHTPESKEQLDRLILETINKAISESQKIAAEKGKALFKDIGLPGL